MDAVHTLTEINIDDLMNAWGLTGVRVGRGLLRALARPAAVNFAHEMVKFDQAVGAGELQAGGRLLCQRYTGGVGVSGAAAVPSNGPVLFLSNHPGMADTVALFSAIPRTDLRVIALQRPFLQALPNTAARLFMLPDDVGARAGVTRAAASYLRRGGAALTFPAGQIEPDPLYRPGAVESLQNWSESVALFARLVPGLQIVVVMVAGVVNPAAFDHPLTRLRRSAQDRELSGGGLQLLWPGYQRNRIQVAIAPPLAAEDLLARDPAPAAVNQAIIQAARSLLENWPQNWDAVLPAAV